MINQNRTFPNTEAKRNQLDATSAALLIITDKILCSVLLQKTVFRVGNQVFSSMPKDGNLNLYLDIWSANLIQLAKGFRSIVNIYISMHMMLILLIRTPYARVGSWTPISHMDIFLGGMQGSESGALSLLHSLARCKCVYAWTTQSSSAHLVEVPELVQWQSTWTF